MPNEEKLDTTPIPDLAELEGPIGPEDTCEHTKSIGPNILLEQPTITPAEPRIASVIDLHGPSDKPTLDQALESVMRPVSAMAEFYGCRVMVVVVEPNSSYQFKSSLDLNTAIGLLHRMLKKLENEPA